MSRPKTLDAAAPVVSLRDAAGLTQVQLAALDGHAQSTIAGAEKRAGGIGLDVLVRLCAAAGGRLVLRFEKSTEPE